MAEGLGGLACFFSPLLLTLSSLVYITILKIILSPVTMASASLIIVC
jgi:hypothetical protein